MNRGQFGGAVHNAGRQFRSEIEDQSEQKPRELQQHSGGVRKLTEFFTTASAQDAWNSLMDFFYGLDKEQEEEEEEEGKEEEEELAFSDLTITEDENTYKFKASVSMNDTNIGFQMKITQVNEGLRSVSFMKTAGNTLDFNKLFHHVLAKNPGIADGVPPN
jgi:hypothetical protein